MTPVRPTVCKHVLRLRSFLGQISLSRAYNISVLQDVGLIGTSEENVQEDPMQTESLRRFSTICSASYDSDLDSDNTEVFIVCIQVAAYAIYRNSSVSGS